MKHKGIVAAVIIILAILIAGGILGGTYNGMVRAKEEIDKAFSDIDTQLQRRSDLIPNLLASVKGYMQHEEAVITAVSDARAQLAGATTSAEKIEANDALDGALSRLLVVVENYPDLKADQQFTALSDELAGTENRIAVARRDYNSTVQSYNTSIKTFPKNLFASMFGFSAEPYFEASESAKDVPKVEF